MAVPSAALSLRHLNRAPAPEALGDERLIVGIRNRDEAALAALYTRYAEVISGLALRIVRNPEVAEEIVQETFMRVWRGAHRFHGSPSGLRAWLFCIGRNLALDHLRRQAARPRTVTITPDPTDNRAPLDMLADETCDVAMQATDHCLHEQMRRALLTLPTEQRHVLERAYFGGRTHREIADETGEPLGTIKTRLRLGLQKLATIARQEAFER